MKYITLTACLFIIYSCCLFAQNSNTIVKAGEKMNDAISPKVKFRYPDFVSGNISFKDGTHSEAPLDFNLLNEEMQFIDAKGDTLSLDNEATIKYITINNDTFYYSKGYLELIAGNSLVKLAKKQRLKIGDVRKIGGYDQASPVSAITSYSSINNGSQLTSLTQRADILLSKETTYFIGDNYNHFLPANKKNIMKVFGKKEAAIDKFLEENTIKYNNQNDLKKLIDFLAKIQ